MQKPDDIVLLREYAERGSEEAFAALVTRHVNKVYSVALRHTRNPDSAGEITQAVFVILAREASQLRRHALLSGWIYQTARLTSVTFVRSEIRRVRREQEAQMQTVLEENESADWTQIAPLLDTAMARLNESDRHAVVLRFFDGKSMAEIGATLGASEEAAKKRVGRALEKLRGFFAKHGVHSTADDLAKTISANSVQVAPIALAKSVTAVALAKGAASSTSTLALIKGALKIMAWTKTKIAIATGVVVLLTAGTATVIVNQQYQSSRKSVTNQTKFNPGDVAPDKVSFMAQMNSIKTTVIPAFVQYAKEHNDDIPKSMADLQPYLPPNSVGMDDDHWEIIATGKFTPQLTQKNIILFQQKYFPDGQFAGLKIIGYTDGHFTAKK